MSTENPSDPVVPGPSRDALDDAMTARLQAADPAATAEPDRASLRAKIDAAVAAPVAASAAEDGAVDDAGVGGTGPDAGDAGDDSRVVRLRPRRTRRSGWLLAAAATGAIALTAGGFLVGNQVADGQVAAERTVVPAISLGSGSGSDPAGTAAGAADGGAAVGAASGAPEVAPEVGVIEPAQAPGHAAGASSDASTKVAQDSAMWGPGSPRTVFRDGGVTGEAGTAPGYAYDATAAATEESARTLAGVFGVTGDPRAEYGTWTIGSTDGTGPAITLSGDGMARFNYFDPAAQLFDCSNVDRWYAENSDDAVSSDGAGGSDGGAVPPECATRDVGPAPTGEAAAKRIGEVLTALGMDPGQFVLTENPVEDAESAPNGAAAGQQNWITGERLIGDQRSGDIWSFSFVGDDLAAVDGSLATVVPFGEFPVIGAAEAVQRLNDPRFGPANVVYPADHVWPEGGQPEAAKDGVSAPELPAAGTPVTWASSEATLVSARLGVAPHYLANGAVQLVPAYSLTDDKGVNWTVIAVADSALEFSAR